MHVTLTRPVPSFKNNCAATARSRIYTLYRVGKVFLWGLKSGATSLIAQFLHPSIIEKEKKRMCK